METKIKKMYARDSLVIIISLVGFLTFIPYVMSVVADLAPTPSIRLLIVGAGVLVCLFGAASLIAVIAHLKRNRVTLYTKELSATPAGKQTSTLWLQIVDSLFVMLLCFATLLSAMVMNKGAGSGISYSIHTISVVATVCGLIIYLYYLLNQSEKGLRSMVLHIYGKK